MTQQLPDLPSRPTAEVIDDVTAFLTAFYSSIEEGADEGAPEAADLVEEKNRAFHALLTDNSTALTFALSLVSRQLIEQVVEATGQHPRQVVQKLSRALEPPMRMPPFPPPPNPTPGQE